MEQIKGRLGPATGLSVSFDFLEGPFTCADPFGGLATGSMAVAPSSSPSHLVLRLAGSLIGATVPLSESVEYYAFKLRLHRSRSVGPGACAGCDQAVCIVLDSMQLFQPLERGCDPSIANGIFRQFAVWQHGDLLIGVEGAPDRCVSFPFVPISPTTWGRLRNLYR